VEGAPGEVIRRNEAAVLLSNLNRMRHINSSDLVSDLSPTFHSFRSDNVSRWD